MDSFDLCCAGRDFERLVREAIRIDVSKALDPLDPDDYVKIVARLSRSMERSTRDTEAAILRKAIKGLDVDWPNISPRQRAAVIRAARSTLQEIPKKILPAVSQRFEAAGPSMVNGTRRAVRREFNLNIGSSLALRDQAVLDHLVSSQSLYITDEYARRRATYSATARRIVGEGLRDGIGRAEIADALRARLGVEAGLRRSAQYWQVIAAAFTNRARVFGHLSGFREAGIERFIFEAVLDERTTDQCRFLHGKRFSVGNALTRYQQAAEAGNPEDVKSIMPWIRSRKGPDGKKRLFVRRGDQDIEVATVERSAVGQVDDLGEFSNALNASELDSVGAYIPPLHGSCRSTTLPDV